MKNNEPKPREYEVAVNNYDRGECLVKRSYDGLIYEDWLKQCLEKGSWSSFKVIEKSAYDELLADAEKLVEVIALAKMENFSRREIAFHAKETHAEWLAKYGK